MPIYGVLSVTVFPPNSIIPDPLPPIVPSPENILEHMKLTKSTAIETFASFIQVWALIPEAVEYLKTLRFVVRPIRTSDETKFMYTMYIINRVGPVGHWHRN